jgi:hypothetical protein
MNLELLYAAVGLGVLPAWVLLAAAPGWTWTDRLIHRIWLPASLCMSWAALYAFKPATPIGAGLGSLPAFVLLLSSPYSALLFWIQLNTWDLFIGAWQVRDARRRGIAHAWVLPSLLGTLLLGPIGLLIYLAIRWVLRGTTSLQEVVGQEQSFRETRPRAPYERSD